MPFCFEHVVIGSLGVFLGTLVALLQHTRYQVAVAKLAFVQKNLQLQKEELKEAQAKNLVLTQQVSQLQEVKQGLLEKIAHHAAASKSTEEQLLLQFKNLSNELLDSKSEKFVKQNKTQIEALLTPLRERITDFQQQVANNQRHAKEGTLTLQQEFQKVHALYDKIREESAKTTRAILGDNKLQGTWGEVHAQQILENTGLRQNEQYFIQKSFAAQDGKRLIPDIIIKLPNDRSIVMDVKVSLVHYVKFFNATTSNEKEFYLKKHLVSLKSHIKSLSEKNYAQVYQLDGLDFVLMLLPVEPAFSLAIQHEPSLFQEAYEHNIVLVSPTTLRATLSIIEHVWKNTNRNQHALEIARQSGALYDKFANFVEDVKKIGHQLTQSQKSYEQAINKLSEGKGNLLHRVEKLKQLGARTKKNLASSEDLHSPS